MKGQWFLISAVIITGIFLTISFVLKSYYYVDTSKVAVIDEDYYFKNIVEQLKNVVRNGGEYSINEFIFLSEKMMAEKGYYLEIKRIENGKYNVTLKSDRMRISKIIEC